MRENYERYVCQSLSLQWWYRASSLVVEILHVGLRWTTLYFSLSQQSAMATSIFPSENVITTVCMMALMPVVLTLYSCTTKNFTFCCGLIWVLFFVPVFPLIMNYFGYMTYDAWWHPLVIGIVAFCYGLYLIADMEALAFDGKHLLNNEDYVTGTLMLYLDILLYCHYFAKLIPTRNTIR